MKNLIKKIKKEQIIIFASGLILGLFIMFLFFPDRIAQLANGEQVAVVVGKKEITADTLYKTLKEGYGINSLIESIDRTILEEKYTLTEEDKKDIDNTAQNYINYYKESYNKTQEDFLTKNGFDTYEEFKEYLELDYMRSLFYREYLIKNMTEEEINNFYKNNTFGTIKTEHILVPSSTENAKEKALEILSKLKNGATWDSVKEEYKSIITTESVSVSFDSSLENAYIEEAKRLTDGSISNSLVKTSYGYHILYRISSEEKPEESVLDSRIKTALISELEKKESNLYEKTMIKMREEAKTDIKDTELNKVYKKYIKQFK